MYCDLLDFVDFLSVLAKFIMLNVLACPTWGLLECQAPTSLEVFSSHSNVHLFRLELAFLFFALAYGSH